MRAQPSMAGRRSWRPVSTREPYVFSDAGARVARRRLRRKRSILRRLAWAGAAVTVFPHDVDARRARRATTACCSRTAPGDPEPLGESRDVRGLLGRTPVLGICLGHQLLALATGHETFKLPFGHRGANHPVVERGTGRVLVTSQNHGFAVAPSEAREATHVSLYDGPSRGSTTPSCARAPSSSTPRPGPGPHDAWGLIDGWVEEVSCGLPRRRDIESICLIGSGPIVIGQACEFDYAGCQALKVLREDGFRTIVVNSNPATIMTDPASPTARTSSRSTSKASPACSSASGPTRCCRRWAARPLSTSRVALAEEGILDELGVELIGAPIDVIRARRGPRAASARPCSRRGLRVPESTIVTSLGRRAGGPVPAGRSCGRRSRSAATAAGPRDTPEELERQLERGARREPGRPGARRGVAARLGRVRARADARPPRQRVVVCSIENLDPMGVHTGDSVTVAPQMTLSDEAYQELRDAAIAVIRAVGVDMRRLEHPVRARPRDRRAARDRDEPARLALVRARLEGDRLSDREGRREARGRLHARRDPERPDRDDAGELRADARLRRRQVPALRLREVPRRRHDARHADEVGRRGDGHRPHVQRGVPEGDAARASSTRRATPWQTLRRPEGVHPWFRAEIARIEERCDRVATSTISSPTTGCG